ncbi:amidohydrolase [Nisaea acidiphila]|uniref:Amidohydrolase n=1 Tax=Nisaea acidiphila TaxID=1862145 RepID=A0A9J7AUU1_9PROT|nr:amidohydrolase [Nisaea acidiphila]UUX51515.1 amidohydrolase [Nisaea acidiphila]
MTPDTRNYDHFLTPDEEEALVAFRHDLHRHPELSGEEEQTAARVVEFVGARGPDRILTGLGGHGVAAIFEGTEPGPTLLVRSELDALPIQELSGLDYISEVPGKAHLCGHDGHTATVAALAYGLERQRPAKGRVVLMFQPAEETGAGSAAVIADPRYGEIRPDMAISLHNMPGAPIGHATLAPGIVCCASRGMEVCLTGKTAHASQPETGISPMAALSALMPALTALGGGNVKGERFSMVTVTHASMGEPAYGVAPGAGRLMATLRTKSDGEMAALIAAAEELVERAAKGAGLGFEISYDDIFDASENHPDAVHLLEEALDARGVTHDAGELPFRGSEDFGRFGQGSKGAMFFLGAGAGRPHVHNPDYVFPDELIGIGSGVFMHAIRSYLG